MKLQIRNRVIYPEKFGILRKFTILRYKFLGYTNFSYRSRYRLLQRNFHVKLIIFAFNSVILNANSTWIYLKIMHKHLYDMFDKITHIRNLLL